MCIGQLLQKHDFYLVSFLFFYSRSYIEKVPSYVLCQDWQSLFYHSLDRQQPYQTKRKRCGMEHLEIFLPSKFSSMFFKCISRNFPNTCFYGRFWAKCTQIEATCHPGTPPKFVYIWQKIFSQNQAQRDSESTFTCLKQVIWKFLVFTIVYSRISIICWH